MRFDAAFEALIAPCEDGPDIAHQIPLIDWLFVSTAVIEISSADFGALSVPDVLVWEITDNRSVEYYEISPSDGPFGEVKGEGTEPFKMLKDRFELLRAVGSGNHIIMVLSGRDRWANGLTALISPDGQQVSFVGECAETYSDELEAFRKDRGDELEADARALLIDLFTETTGAGAEFDAWWHRDDVEEVAWIDQDPDLRLLDAGAPAEVWRDLEAVDVAFEVPSSWMQYAPGTVCTKVPGLGWNACFELVEGGETTQTISQAYRTDVPLEVWALDVRADVTNPVALLATVAVEELQRWEPGSTVSLTFE